MKINLAPLVLAAALIGAGLALALSLPTYAIVNAGNQSWSGFYRVNVRSGAVRACSYNAKGWHCSNVGNL